MNHVFPTYVQLVPHKISVTLNLTDFSEVYEARNMQMLMYYLDFVTTPIFKKFTKPQYHSWLIVLTTKTESQIWSVTYFVKKENSSLQMFMQNFGGFN